MNGTPLVDRNVQFPNRYQQTPVSGTANIVDLTPAPGEVTDEGTLINKGVLYSDDTKALYPAGVNNPNDAFETLSKAGLIASNSENGWELEETSGVTDTEINPVGPGYAFSSRPNVLDDGTFDTTGGTECTGASYNGSGSTATSGETSFAGFLNGFSANYVGYYVPNSNKKICYSYKYYGEFPEGIASAAGATYNYVYFTSDASPYLSKIEITEETTTQTYYLTDIFGNKVVVGPQIYTGSYTGTGTYGSRNKNTLTFPFEPKLVFVILTSAYPVQTSYCLEIAGQFLIPWGISRISASADTNGSGSYVPYLNFTYSGTSLSWYASMSSGSANATHQFNTSGASYSYVAIG